MHFRRNTPIIIILKTLLNKTHSFPAIRLQLSDSLQDEVKLWKIIWNKTDVWTLKTETQTLNLNESLRRTNHLNRIILNLNLKSKTWFSLNEHVRRTNHLNHIESESARTWFHPERNHSDERIIWIILNLNLNSKTWFHPERITQTNESSESESYWIWISKMWFHPERITQTNESSESESYWIWIWTARRDFILNESLRRTNHLNHIESESEQQDVISSWTNHSDERISWIWIILNLNPNKQDVISSWTNHSDEQIIWIWIILNEWTDKDSHLKWSSKEPPADEMVL